jgi:hypothetical protein
MAGKSIIITCRAAMKQLTTGGLRDLVGLRVVFSPPVDRYILEGVEEGILL